MLVVSSVVLLAVLIFSIGQGLADGDDETPVSIYYPTYLILTTGVMVAFIAGDLFNLYVGFEILLVASYVLITLGGTRSRIRAGVTYVIVSLLSSILFLAAIGMVYGALGTVNLAQVAERVQELPLDCRSCCTSCCSCLRHQGGRLPAVVLAARQLPLGTGAGHRGLRGPAHQDRRLRDHPARDGHLPDPGAESRAARRRAADHGGRRPRRGGPGRHQADPVVHPRQPHRLHDPRRRPRNGGGNRGGDLLHRPPHRRADHSLPRRWPGRARGGQHLHHAHRRAAGERAARRGAVLHPGPQPRRHPAVLRLHRQARPVSRPPPCRAMLSPTRSSAAGRSCRC